MQMQSLIQIHSRNLIYLAGFLFWMVDNVLTFSFIMVAWAYLLNKRGVGGLDESNLLLVVKIRLAPSF